MNKEEYRRVMHLGCEHRRRSQIQDGIDKFEQLIPVKLKGAKRLSKADILHHGVTYMKDLMVQVDKAKEELKREETVCDLLMEKIVHHGLESP